VAPAIGSALPISCPEVLVNAAHADGLDGAMLSTCVLLGLEQLNVQLLAPDKQPYPDTYVRLERMGAISASYLERRLPTLQRLGALPKPRRR
jgi:hypothetical protein